MVGATGIEPVTPAVSRQETAFPRVSQPCPLWQVARKDKIGRPTWCNVVDEDPESLTLETHLGMSLHQAPEEFVNDCRPAVPFPIANRVSLPAPHAGTVAVLFDESRRPFPVGAPQYALVDGPGRVRENLENSFRQLTDRD
jgi:hypothetical protein